MRWQVRDSAVVVLVGHDGSVQTCKLIGPITFHDSARLFDREIEMWDQAETYVFPHNDYIVIAAWYDVKSIYE